MNRLSVWGRASLGAFALASFSSVVSATDYVVTSAGDTIAMDGVVTLREALSAANTNLAVGDAAPGSVDGDSIVFSAAVFASDASISLSGTALPISDDVTVDGEVGDARISISANDLSRVFEIETTTAAGDLFAVNLTNLILSDGLSLTSGGAVMALPGSDVNFSNVDIHDSEAQGLLATEGGGAIYAAGVMTLSGGSLSGNTASGDAGSGGAIFVAENATLSVDGSSFSNNSSSRAGGAIESRAGSTTNLTNVTMDSNTTGAAPGNGGGLHITGNGDATIVGGTFSGNVAAREGGALWNGSGSMSVTDATIQDNSANGVEADDGGGGIFNNGGILIVSNTSFSGNEALGAAGSGGAILNADGGTLTVNGGTMSGNSSSRAGGAIEDVSGADTVLTLTGVTLQNNATGPSPGNGGGLHITGPGPAVLSGLTVTSNTAAREGGGLWNGSATMTIDGSDAAVLISGNTASGPAADDGGGGVFNNGGSVVVIGDVTISNNIADGASGSGGGVFSLGGSFAATDTVISGNRANRAGGGIEVALEHALTLTNVTLTNNNAGVDPATAAPGNGGALHVSGTGTADIIGGSVVGNLAAAEGGGLWNQAGTVMVVDSVMVSGNDAQGTDASQGGGGLFNNGGSMQVVDSMIHQNTATTGSGSGGGLLNDGGSVSISDSIFSANVSARAGGAIEDRSADQSTTLSIVTSTLRDNTTGSSPGNGGGLHVSGPNSLVTVDRSAVSNNLASNEGGGLWNFSGSQMDVVNSTISGNRADGNGGGGLFNQPAGVLNVTNITVANNTAPAGAGGGLLTAETGSTTALNSLFGDNSAATDDDVSGELSAGDDTLIETLDGDLGLAALASNGGPTQTHALTGNSLAVGRALSAVCANAPVNAIDQRGVARAATCESGAYEVTNGPTAGLTPVTVPPQSVVTGASNVVALAFQIANGQDEAMAVNGFSGTISGTAIPTSAVAAARIYLDTNGNGVIDAGESVVSTNVNITAGQFQAAFNPARVIGVGGSESYILAVDISPNAKLVMTLAGLGLLPLLLAFPGAAFGRKQRAVIAALAATLLLGACSSNNLDSSQIVPPTPTTLKFRLTSIDATGTGTGLPAQLPNQSAVGPTITVN